MEAQDQCKIKVTNSQDATLALQNQDARNTEATNSQTSALLPVKVDSCFMAINSQDLLSTFLLDVSPEDLMAFHAVSRDFDHVLNDHTFCKEHAKHHKDVSPIAVFFHRKFCKPEFCFASLEPSIPQVSQFATMVENKESLKVVNSSRGLFLGCLESESARSYCVFNPMTKSFRHLPQLQTHTPQSATNSTNPHPALAFKPSQPGFKVYFLTVGNLIKDKKSCNLMVYSDEEGSRFWRRSHCEFNIPVGYGQIHQGIFHDEDQLTWICDNGLVHLNVKTEKVIEEGGTRLDIPWKDISFFGESTEGTLMLIQRRRDCGVYVYRWLPDRLMWELHHAHCQGLSQQHSHDQLTQVIGYKSREHKLIIHAHGGEVYTITELLKRSGGGLHRSIDRLTHIPGSGMPLPDHDFSSGCVSSYLFVPTLYPV